MKASENPFRSEEVAKLRYCIGAERFSALARRVLTMEEPHCIVGPEGTGKTTLLEDTHDHLNSMGHDVEWIRLTNDSPRKARKAVVKRLLHPSTDRLYFFDGGEVLTGLDWWRIRRAGRCGLKLIATLHKNRALGILHKTAPDWSITKELVAKLHQDEHIEKTARKAFRENGGNVREVFRACYWTCAKDQA